MGRVLYELIGAKPFGALVPVNRDDGPPRRKPARVYVAIAFMAVAGYMARFAVMP